MHDLRFLAWLTGGEECRSPVGLWDTPFRLSLFEKIGCGDLRMGLPATTAGGCQ